MQYTVSQNYYIPDILLNQFRALLLEINTTFQPPCVLRYGMSGTTCGPFKKGLNCSVALFCALFGKNGECPWYLILRDSISGIFGLFFPKIAIRHAIRRSSSS